ncbi:HAD hydrolase-like protein [Rhodococcus sp. HNM0563]|uniref:HAD hydrolase-like protein n=1 Tax=unclassified Rhodococcus (in: high G+C Gram-positive bacteria) TaxID=192944 RepID=UPI00146D19E8|nr:HAD hydrolase-like protein [Rhodococcus sp. F64268]MCK0090840.1 HAD hydrolase-like protein [Rhodococcus sp. F64268]NLU61118.1 HAD hydrolase-like protein [Rhodococcus sp. HNM0563]
MTLLVDPHPLTLPAPVVLFDLDGTLTDSATGVINGFLHAAAVVGFGVPDGNLEWLLGPPMRDTLRSFGLGDDEVERGLTAYREYYTDTGWSENALFDGVGTMLAAVRDTGTRLAVATSKNESAAVRILEHFGIADHFEFIGGASEDGVRRAKADVVAHSLAALGIEAVDAAHGGTSDVVMVGDREHDIHGAGRFGIPTLFVEWGYGTGSEGAVAAKTVATVDELQRLLTGGR